uniref:Uncharacterized protein n=1 Tax=Romanomermis culicivorax TaxID=13658 RepID=A0A915HGW3_ROMCU
MRDAAFYKQETAVRKNQLWQVCNAQFSLPYFYLVPKTITLAHGPRGRGDDEGYDNNKRQL